MTTFTGSNTEIMTCMKCFIQPQQKQF